MKRGKGEKGKRGTAYFTLLTSLVVAFLTFSAQAQVVVQTLGGGPNQASAARAGAKDGDTLAFAKFNGPFAVAQDSAGNLYVADRNNGKLRKITHPGAADSLTSTLVSGLRSPVGVAVGASNILYVITEQDGRLHKFGPAGVRIGDPVSGLIRPTALALDGAGNVYVTELGGAVRRVLPDGSIDLNVVTSGLNRPRGIVVLRSGLLAVSESGAHSIVQVDPLDGLQTVLAGRNGAGFAEGPGQIARFNQPHGLALSPDGRSIVVADRRNHRVRVVGTNGFVSTLYGVPRSQWSGRFAGWVDGPGGPDGIAAANNPVGVSFGTDGNLYATELGWHLVRRATGTGLGGTNMGNVTNIVIEGTNVMVLVGTNVVSFGFESGEASSVFVAAPGQKFYAPVTLANAPGQRIYTFQMSLSVTGETGLVLDGSQLDFKSMVDKQEEIVMRNDLFIPPVFTTNIFYVPITNNIVFRNASINMLGVGWLTRYQETNLYNTIRQDLITYSIAKDNLLGSGMGKVVLGAYGVRIPAMATESDTLLIRIGNPSGTSDGITTPVLLTVPTNGSLSGGAPNSIKRLTMGSRLYVVGDSTPFRWFNAGDFGDTNLANSDVTDVFQAAAYNLNTPIGDSDLFDAMDSSDGSSISSPDDLFNGDAFYTAAAIDSITTGDADLNLDDVFVTFRRSLDPTLKWYARYWTNGGKQVVEVPNTLADGAGGGKSVLMRRKAAGAKSIANPILAVGVDDASATPNSTLHLPIRVQIGEPYALRTMLFNISVEALDGSPAISDGIQLQMAPSFGEPDLRESRGAHNFAGAWLDNQITGISGNSVLAILTVRIPATAGAGAAYRVHFDHFSGSPNGLALFDTRTSSGLILLSDRSTSTWGDGISDAWRLRYFGSISAPDSAVGADPDFDGVFNSHEYLNGTDPTDPTSN